MKKLTLAYSPFSAPAVNSIFPFDAVYEESFNAVDKGSLAGADALLLWGGTDIHPTFYQQPYHPLTERSGNGGQPSLRDMTEWHLMREAKKLKIPIIGVCRGAQFLCVFSGGSLIQDVKGHYHAHGIVTDKGLSMHASANHHQIMNPKPGTYELLAWSEFFGAMHQDGFTPKPIVSELMDKKKDPEILWFPDVKGLAIQPHPEWMPIGAQFVKHVVSLVRQFCVPL